LIASIDPKIEIIDSEWPDMRVDGAVLSIEANKVMDLAETTDCNWGLYIQADGVIHEDDREKIRAACEYWCDHDHVKSLLFGYFLKQGFLDGYYGFIISIMNAYSTFY
jgi:hypothetical protein